MKDTEFIELLNLYLDHEISGPDAVRLEAEVQNNPARRRVYEQYCRMQKACKVLAKDFATETASVQEKKVVAFSPTAATRTSRANGFYTVGAFAAAAACLAVIFVGRSRQEATTSAPPAASEVIAIRIAPPAPVRRTGVTFTAGDSHNERPARLVSQQLLLTGGSQSESMLANSMQQGRDQFEWIGALQIAPLQQRVSAEELRFDVRPATLRPEGRGWGAARGRVPSDGKSPPTEMISFEFQK